MQEHLESFGCFLDTSELYYWHSVVGPTNVEDQTCLNLPSQLLLQQGVDVFKRSVDYQDTCMAVDIDGLFQFLVLWVCWLENLPDSG